MRTDRLATVRHELDEIDFQLIEELRIDGRASQSALGSKVGLTQTAVRRRINHLLGSGIIRVTAVTDPSLLGIACMGIVGATVTDSKDEVAAELASIPGTGSVFIASGLWDVVIELRRRNTGEFLEVVERIRATQGVARMETLTYLDVVKDSFVMPARDPLPGLDPTDIAIIAQLEIDGRLSYADLAPKVGLSETAVRTRILRLLRSGAISVIAQVDRATFGIELETAFTVEVSGPVRAAAEQASTIPEVVFLAITAGRFDVIGNLSCRSSDHALEKIEQIRALPGVRTVTPLAQLRTVREAYPSVTTWERLGPTDAARTGTR